ncbi:hypothetical protein [Streptomyces sp. NPDC059894]|uniref:hypothetical protein n=1 Tax=unclassified Streptomyces TaxID=2593676 RepID=UPI0036605E48
MRPALPRSSRHRPAPPRAQPRTTASRKAPGRSRHRAGAAHLTTRAPEKPVAPRTPPPISNRLKPRLATALFRHYLRACIPTRPDRPSPLAGARPEAVLAETQDLGQRHHH